jgi:predicted nucleic acid-binding protein
MILVDTSVWIDHLRLGDPELASALQSCEVLCHPHVVGELACGNLRARDKVITLLQALPVSPVVSDKESLCFIDNYSLMARGIGYIDVQLLASARLAGAHLWTRDKRLQTVALELGLAHLETKH